MQLHVQPWKEDCRFRTAASNRRTREHASVTAGLKSFRHPGAGVRKGVDRRPLRSFPMESFSRVCLSLLSPGKRR
jgi:hypothetical protein